MEMQGTPIGSTNQGTKNTSDPERYENPIKEGAGAVARDSLAAESATSGGSFRDNRDSDPLAVEGGKSTLANTDTSAARTIPPSSDKASGGDDGGDYAGDSSSADRGGNSDSGGAFPEKSGNGGDLSKPEVDSGDGVDSLDKPSRTGQSYASAAGGSDESSSGGLSGGGSSESAPDGSSEGTPSGEPASSSSNTGGNSTSAGTAPSYTADLFQLSGGGKPKGKNLTEGGFDGEAEPTTDIGGENDPGRKAEGDFQRITQSASGGTGPTQGKQSGDTPYSALEADQGL